MQLISQNHVFNQIGRMESCRLGPKLNVLQSVLAAHDDHIEQTAKFFSKKKKKAINPRVILSPVTPGPYRKPVTKTPQKSCCRTEKQNLRFKYMVLPSLMVSLGEFAVSFLELYFLGHKNTRLVYTGLRAGLSTRETILEFCQ